MTAKNRIGIHNQEFLTMSLIARCPRTMMIRELVMNAIEAATQNPGGGEVQFKVVHVHGIAEPKLAIYNDGPGMDAATLLSMCDLASSGKTLGIDKNFGMGAKVAALGSNHAGLRYWSCKDGTVSEVTMGHDGEEYVIFSYEGSADAVTDVTDAARDAGYPMDREWTEVVLCGMEPTQDTVKCPFGKPVHRQWIGTELIQRFDSIPDNVAIRLMEGTNPRGESNRTFAPFHEKVSTHGKISVERDPETGIGIRYMYDHKRDDRDHLMSVNGSVTTARIGGGIVYKGEIYEVLCQQKWGANAPAYGITFGSKQLSVMVMLPDDYPVRPEQYRQFLTHAEGDKKEVLLEDFREAIVDLMPEWFKDKIHDLQPKSATNMDDLQRKLQEWMNQKRSAPPRSRPGPDGALQMEDNERLGVPPVTQGDYITEERRAAESSVEVRAPRVERANVTQTSKPYVRVAPPGSRPAKLAVTSGLAPRIVKLDDAAEVEEKGFLGMAAKYVPTNNTLFVNMNYTAIVEARDMLSSDYATAAASDAMGEQIIRESSELAVVQAIGYAVAYALVKHGQDGWAKANVEAATCPESLSIAADGWEKGATDIKRGLSKRLGRSPGTKASSEPNLVPA